MSDSESSQQQSTNQTDNRRVIGQGGVSAENSNVSVLNQVLDKDVANAAFKANGTALTDALGFGSEALGFGKNAITAALNAQSDALGFADTQATRYSTLAYNALNDAQAASENAFTSALSFSKGVTNRAFDSVLDTNNLVKDAYADAKGRGALTDKILIGAIAAMAVVAFAAIKK